MYIKHTDLYENHTLFSDPELKIMEIFLDLKRHYFAEMAKKSELTRPRTLRALRKLERLGLELIK